MKTQPLIQGKKCKPRNDTDGRISSCHKYAPHVGEGRENCEQLEKHYI